MTEHDPPRLGAPGSGDSERLSRLLDGARADVGTDAEVNALHAALAANLWPDGNPPGGGHPPPGPDGASAGAGGGATTGGSALALKAGIGALLVVAAAGTWLATRSGGETPPIEPRAAKTETEAPAANINPPGTGSEMPADRPAVLQPESRATGDSSGIISVAPPSSVTPKKVGDAAPSESALLGQAQAALSRNASLALSLSEQHRAWYPRGVLVQEREVIAMEALKRLGRQGEASARAARFLKAFPTSAHRSKVESLVPPR